MDDADPYQSTEHVDGCDEDVWVSRGEQILIESNDLIRKRCPACNYQWDLWGRIIDEIGDCRYGEIGIDILNLDTEVADRPWMIRELNAVEYDLLLAVRNEQRMFERSKIRSHREQAEAAQSSTRGRLG